MFIIITLLIINDLGGHVQWAQSWPALDKLWPLCRSNEPLPLNYFVRKLYIDNTLVHAL